MFILNALLIMSASLLLLLLATIGSQAESSWDQIETHIQPSGQHPNSELDNMDTLMRWLKNFRKGKRMFSKNLDHALIESLEKIETLRTLYMNTQCNHESMEFRKDLGDSVQGFYNLSRLHQFYAGAIAKICYGKHPSRYFQLKQGYGDENFAFLRRLEMFFSSLIQDQMIGQIDNEAEIGDSNIIDSFGTEGILDQVYDGFIRNKGLINSDAAVRIAYLTIKRLASIESDVYFVQNNIETVTTDGPVFNPKQAVELFYNFIYRSCKSYVDYFGPSVFQMAEYDSQFMDSGERVMGTHSGFREYIFAWAQYEGCKHLTNNWQFLDRINYFVERKMYH